MSGRGALIRRLGTGFALVASAVLLVACTGAEPDPTSTPTPTEAPSRPAADVDPVPIAFAPLRGTPAVSAALQHPSLSVKIDNHEEAPMNLLDPQELERLLPAETHSYASPIPTQSVSSDEFMPRPQTATQKRLEARIKDLGGELARRQGMSRRRFFQTAAGMAAAFVAMNEVYGSLYDVSPAEAQTPGQAHTDQLP